MKRVLFLTAIILSLQAKAQDISYGEYMERVLKDNIALTAKSLDLDIADATAESPLLKSLSYPQSR